MSHRLLHALEPEGGGVRQHVLYVTAELARRGWDVEVAVPADARPGSPYRTALEEHGVTVHTLPMRRAFGREDVRAARALRRLDRERGYALVHAHSSKAGALVRSALSRRRRLVYQPHCPGFAAALGPARAAYWAAEQALVPRTGALIACSDWEARLLATRLAGAKRILRTIPNGVPAAAPAAIDPRLADLPRPVIGFLARLDPQKDPLALVAAAERMPDLPGTVAIVGSGRLEAQVRAALGPGMVHVPFEPPVERYLRGFDLFVLPSRWESLPLAVLEAMACGLPVLATDVGGTGEAVQDGVTGRLVPPEDPEALAAALAAMVADPDALARMGAAAARAAAGRFSLARAIDDLEALYHEVLG